MQNTQWKNKRACFLGDSITDGVGVKTGERYFDLLKNDFGMETHGYGVNGANSADVYQQALKVYDTFGNDVDAVFILIGTNDYNSSCPIGEWFTTHTETVVTEKNDSGEPVRKEERIVREFVFDNCTFKGRLNRLFAFLKKQYAEKTIVIMTPLHRAFAVFGRDNIQYNELYANSIGKFIGDYVEAVREAADIWSLSLIDLYRESGLFPLFEESAAAYFTNVDTDRLHPGKGGHERMARVIAAKLPTIAV